MRFHLMTYGCQMNVYDTGTMADLLYERGYEATDCLDDADLVLVNTCAVRESAQNRIWGILGNLATWKRQRPGRVLGVTGCMAQNEGRGLVERCRYVDLVMGPDGIGKLPELLDLVAMGRRGLVCVDQEEAEPEDSIWVAPTAPPLPVAYPRFVSVQKGCNERCTFCIVPSVRGHERYRPIPHVLDEVRMLVDHGYREVTLIGQTVNAYKFGDADFADLLRAVSQVEGLDRLRFTTSHPRWITPRLVEAMGEIPNLCEQLHLPMQTGSDKMLKRMLRRYRVDEYFDLLDQLREATRHKPEPMAISTDLIVGFPGETQEDFELTLAAIERARWDSAFTFIYSPRPGTAALRMKGEVPSEVSHERLLVLVEALNRIGVELNEQLVGRTLEVLVDECNMETGVLKGRSRSMKTVFMQVDGTPPAVGELVAVRTLSAAPHHLKGKVLAREVVPCASLER